MKDQETQLKFLGDLDWRHTERDGCFGLTGSYFGSMCFESMGNLMVKMIIDRKELKRYLPHSYVYSLHRIVCMASQRAPCSLPRGSGVGVICDEPRIP